MKSCGGCGGLPRAGAHFCDACGTELSPAQTPAEYKLVTILFADVVHSMDIAAAVGPERLREIMSEVFDQCATIVRRYEGTVDKFTGDGIMAIFGAPSALEDHAYLACLAAYDMQQALERLAVEVRLRDRAELALRVGLNSGEVITGDIGSTTAGYPAIGEHVGMAQRMESVAPPGGVMLSEATARLIAGRATLGEVERVHIKGRRSPMAARRLLSPTPTIGSRLDAPKLVGRSWELTALESLIEEAAAGHGGFVGVTGAPGVGKSRLAYEAGAIARNRNIEIFTSHCESHTAEIAFHAATGLLRSVFGLHDLTDGAARAAIRASLPDSDDADIVLLDDLLGISEGIPGPIEVAPDARRRRLAGLLNTAATTRVEPALLVVEDLHWIDPPSESMLSDFASILSRTPILLLVTYRPEYRGLLAATPGGQKIALAPLREAHTAELLDTLVGTDVSTAAVKARIAERARGNPFYVQEMVRDLVERTVLEGAPGALVCDRDTAQIGVPSTLQSTIAARIDRLDQRAKRTLNAASVVGARFDAELLRRVIDDVDIEGAVDADLVEQVMYAPRAEFAFRHPLIRTVAYESQLRSDRAGLHRQVAEVVEADDPDAADRNAALIAEHYQAAECFNEAFTWHMRAGDWFASRDITAARLSWQRARELADGLPIADPDRDGMRIAARLPLTRSAWRVGAALAETGYEELRTLSLAAGDRYALTIAMFGQTAHLGLHDCLTAARALGTELVALAESLDDTDLLLEAITISMYASYQSAQMDELQLLAQRVIKITDGDFRKGTTFTNSPLSMATILHSIALCAKALPGWREGFSNVASLGTSDPTALAIANTYKYVFAIPAGVLVADDATRRSTAEVLHAAERFGEDFTVAAAQMTHGMALVCSDDGVREEGFELLEAACDAARRDQFLSAALPTAAVQYARQQLRSGDVDAAIELARSIADGAFDSGNGIITPQATSVLVEALVRRGSGGDVEAATAAVERLAATCVGYTFQELPLLRQRTLIAQARGDSSGYLRYRDRYRKLAGDLGFAGHIAWAAELR